MRENKWLRLLTYVTGLVNQELLLQNEYLAAENRVLRAHLPARLRLSDPERSTLAEIGKQLGRKARSEVACVAKPDTILAWYRRLIASKFDGSKHRSYPGRPRIGPEIEALIVQMARENSGWGYDRIVGALANLGHQVSDPTVGNVLRRNGIDPAHRRSQNTNVEGVHSVSPGGAGRHRLLYSRGSDLAGASDLARAVLHSPREPARQPGWDHKISRRSVDATDGAQRDRRKLGSSGAQALRAARSGHEVLRFIPRDAQSGRHKTDSIAGAQSESKRLRREMGTLGKAGVPVETDPVRRSLAATCVRRVRAAFSHRTKSSGQGQRPALSVRR